MDCPTPSFPPDTWRERVADAAVHAVGVIAALAGCALLAAAAPSPWDLRSVVALGLYGIGLAATFGCSAAYNTLPDGSWKDRFRPLDHAAIFLMIAGTYSPVALLAIGGGWGTMLFAVVWTGALSGAGVKLFAPGRFERASIAAYLALGWVGLAALPLLLNALAPWQFGLLAGGGLLYSAGVAVHLSPRLPYHTAVWHGLVLIAAGCHYAVVLGLAMR